MGAGPHPPDPGGGGVRFFLRVSFNNFGEELPERRMIQVRGFLFHNAASRKARLLAIVCFEVCMDG